jgi:HPt (histidine-containing phosphotransfer) domain-containing protein
MDGYSATRRIREEFGMRQLPIIAMTANALASDREHCLAIGMNDHIPKPIDVTALYATLAHWLGQPGALRELPATAADPAAPRDIDIDAALARLGGNRPMFNRLLTRFRDNQGNVPALLEADRQRGDHSAMILRAHTLRGLAGNLGAIKLSRLAGQLEDRLKAGPPPGDDEQVARLIAGLGEALPAVLAISELAVDPPSAGRPGPGAEMQRENLSNLHRLLDNDDAAAVPLFETMLPWLRQEFDPTLIDRLERQIRLYEFDDALQTLQQFAGPPGNPDQP